MPVTVVEQSAPKILKEVDLKCSHYPIVLLAWGCLQGKLAHSPAQIPNNIQ